MLPRQFTCSLKSVSQLPQATLPNRLLSLVLSPSPVLSLSQVFPIQALMRRALLCAEVAPNAGLSRSCCGLSPIWCCSEISPTGFYSDLARTTGALQSWAEHRYYAEAAPYTPTDNLTHPTIEQGLVDHVELMLYIQTMFNFSSNPVIAIGASYSKHCAVRLHALCLCCLCSDITLTSEADVGLLKQYVQSQWVMAVTQRQYQ